MKTDWKNIVKLASVYAGVMLGAGFASGQELIQYFVRFGPLGMVGLVVSGMVLAVVGWAVMDICVRLGLNGYDEFMTLVLGKRLSVYINIVVLVFIVVLFGAMLSAAGATASEALGLPFSIGTIVMAIICFITFQFGINAIIRINTILTPIFIIGSIFFILYALVNYDTPVFSNLTRPLAAFSRSFLWAAVVYASYNIITSISMLANLRPLVNNRKTAKYAGLLGGAIITGLGFLFALPLIIDFGNLSQFEIPLLALAREHGSVIETFYIILLLSAIYTTAAANGYTIVNWLTKKIGRRFISGVCVSVVGVVLAHIGFSTLVSAVFPLFGYVGLFEIAVIIIFFLFMKKNA